MPINAQCPGCGQTLSVGDEFAGAQGKCPTCGQTQHLEPWGRQGGMIYVHGSTGKSPCQLGSSDDDHKSKHENPEAPQGRRSA